MKNLFLFIRLVAAMAVAIVMLGIAFQLARVGLKVKPRPPAATAPAGAPATPPKK